MEQHNWWLSAELSRMRYDDMHRELQHERFLAEHGLDLWSVMRRVLRLPSSSGRERGAVQIADAPRPLRAAHRPPPGRTQLVEPQPSGAGGDVRDTAA